MIDRYLSIQIKCRHTNVLAVALYNKAFIATKSANEAYFKIVEKAAIKHPPTPEP